MDNYGRTLHARIVVSLCSTHDWKILTHGTDSSVFLHARRIQLTIGGPHATEEEEWAGFKP